MAKLDKYLENMISRGAPILRLDPGDIPCLELPGGHRLTLSGAELMGSVLDGMTREILPEALQTSYLRGRRSPSTMSSVMRTSRSWPARRTWVRGWWWAEERPARPSPGSAAGVSSGGKSQKLSTLISRLLSAGGSDLYLNTGELPIMRLDGRLEVLEGSRHPAGQGAGGAGQTHRFRPRTWRSTRPEATRSSASTTAPCCAGCG